MRQLTFILIFLVGTVYGQKLKDRIQGDWVCVGVFDSSGQPTTGKFGQSNEYLKFSFSKKKLAIAESPFDKDTFIDIAFKENSIDWAPNTPYDLPERIYEVKELDDKHLTLVTTSQYGELVTYKFLNQKCFSHDVDKKLIDNGVLIVKHLRLSKNEFSINRVFEYQITNDSIFLSPSPTFKYSKGGSFGQIFSFNIKLPMDFVLDELTEEMILEFDVFEGGASNFKITKGLRDDLNIEVVRVMERLRKSWTPLIVNKSPIKTTLRFHLYFYSAISDFQLPWK